MDDEFFIEDGYQKIMNIDAVLLQEIARISIYRVNDRKQYCGAIEGFIEDCEDHIRQKALKKQEELGLRYSGYLSTTVDDEMFKKYSQLKIYTYQLLEKRGKIFRTKNIKTYG